MQRVILAILGAQLAPAAVQARNGNVDILLEGTLDGIAAQESAIKEFGEVREGSADVWQAREELDPATRGFAEDLFHAAIARESEIDALLEKHSKNWRVNRMAAVDRNVLRMAVAELLGFP